MFYLKLVRMANSSVDENYTSDINQTSTESGSAGPLVFISALNIFLSITATLGNALIFVAFHKETSIHSPTKLLFRSMAVTDLCAGLISQPLFAVAVVARIIDINFHDEGSIFIGFILCGMSTLISAAISVDRLLALLLGLRYRHVVTLRRTRAVIVCFFTISVSCGAMYFWSQTISWIADNFFGVLSLIISILCYTKIYLTLRRNQAQVQNHVHQGQQNGGEIPLNIARYILVMQRFRVVYYGISHESLVFSRYTHEPLSECVYQENTSDKWDVP